MAGNTVSASVCRTGSISTTCFGVPSIGAVYEAEVMNTVFYQCHSLIFDNFLQIKTKKLLVKFLAQTTTKKFTCSDQKLRKISEIGLKCFKTIVSRFISL